MRTIERSTQFKRDYKRDAKGQHGAGLDALLLPVLQALAGDEPLEPRYRDHDLSGEWAGYRDCHIKPDLARFLYNLDHSVAMIFAGSLPLVGRGRGGGGAGGTAPLDPEPPPPPAAPHKGEEGASRYLIQV